MKKRSKKVSLKSYSIFQESVTWSDVWISYFIRRKKVKEFLTLRWAYGIEERFNSLKEFLIKRKEEAEKEVVYQFEFERS